MAAADASTRSTVLVVEDQDDTACLLRFILERAGHSVTHVADGKTAWELIVSTTPPDLVLLEVMLPCVTGLALLRVIRTTPEWQWIPVILVSAHAQPETMSEAFDLGATEYLKMPFSAERLLKSVNLFLS